MQNRHLHHDEQQAEHAGNRLTEHRRQRRTEHAELEDQDERQIQNDVEHRGEHEEEQRRFAVAQRAQPAGEQVIQERERNARENDDNVIVGLLEAIRRRVHHAQDIPAVNHGQHGHHQREHDGKPRSVGDKFAHAAFFPRAELLRHRNREAGTDAHAEAEHQKVDGAGRAHARERLHPEEAADNQRVNQIV